MRASHITYMKNLIASITVPPILPATVPSMLIPPERVLEVDPPLDSFQETVPFCVIKYVPMAPVVDGKRVRQLDSFVDANGVKNLQYLRRHFSQEFRYSLNFWLEDPTMDVLSSGNFVTDEMGIMDQALMYLAKNLRFATTGQATVEVTPGRGALVTDPAGERGLYKIYIEVVFKDGLYETEIVPTLSGGTLVIDEPIAISEV